MNIAIAKLRKCHGSDRKLETAANDSDDPANFTHSGEKSDLG